MGRKPGGLLLHRAAPISKMVGPANDARCLRRGPILRKFIVEPVAAFGGLDPGESHARGADAAPIDIPLIFGNVDPLDLVIVGARKKISARDAAAAAAGEKRDACPRKRAHCK